MSARAISACIGRAAQRIEAAGSPHARDGDPDRLKSPKPLADTCERAIRRAPRSSRAGRFRGEGRGVAVNNVQRFREAQMMSKAELARKAGLSTLTIDRLEAGRPCRLDTKRKVLLALGMRVSDKDRVFGIADAGSRMS
jgi:DNA-binding XRE family transcriptional regulator